MPTLIQYSENEVKEQQHLGFKECWDQRDSSAVNWINIEATTGPNFESLVETLDLHQLMIEDIRNSKQLPKFEVFDAISFMSIQMIHRHKITKEAVKEHLSILIVDHTIITIQEDSVGDVFDPIRQKIKLSHKRISKSGVDYLFLSFLDAIVDEYMATVDAFRQPIEDLEMTMVKRPNISVMPRIMEFKSRLNTIRRFTAPLREELQRIRTENPELIKKQNQIFFRDIQDHINTLISNFENFREMLRDLADLHNSNQNLTLNNTMKTLTSISAVFIPLTFVVGVYGMNFKHFPELEWKYGYLFIWLIMLLISGLLVAYMKKKGWF